MFVHLRNHCCLFSTLLLTMLPAAALEVYPPEVRLSDASHTQRMVALITREDGITADSTATVSVSFEQEGVAQWLGGSILPMADGETTAIFTIDGEEVRVPVTVTNAASRAPASFQNDVLPVLMRAGCNSGGCHGSADGQNGFAISLFGFDPSYDYISLTRDQHARRINVAVPDESLLLLKPLGAVPHEGGTALEKDSLAYELLHRWIAEGAKDDSREAPALEGIRLLPEQAVLSPGEAPQPFLVIADYADGSQREVTELAVLSSSDDLTVTIGEDGQAEPIDHGEAYLMALYGAFAVVSQVMVVPDADSFEWPDDATPANYIDEHVYAKLQNLRIPPAERADDATFVRRIYLDILGVLPTIAETRAFLDDDNPDKRAALIDTLVERPEFVDLWAMKWAEALQVRTTNELDAKGMHRYNDWLRETVAQNVPADQFVYDLLTASGGTFSQPATNFYVLESDPNQIAENVAQVFFGIRLQCAQCHDHPFERWTMDDYYSFSSFFAQVGRKGDSDPRERVIFNRGSGNVRNLRDNGVMEPAFLGEGPAEINGRDRREVLAEWLTSDENPWFAQNLANRVWAHFLGRGIIDPVDDVRVSNPPSHPALLEAMAERLVEYRYDMRALIRDIANSNTYQQSTRPRTPGIRDDRNFAYATIRRMPAEQLLDAISKVTETQVKFNSLPLGARAVQTANGNTGNYFLSVFGRPDRGSACTCDREEDPTLAQTLHLINGATIEQAITASGGLLSRLHTEEKTADAIIDDIYLAAFSRFPTEDEALALAAHVEGAEDSRAALEDIFWSLLNAKEFVFMH